MRITVASLVSSRAASLVTDVKCLVQTDAPPFLEHELRVAAFISEHAEDVAFLSVNDLARQLETSDATIVRTAQALGYTGFPDLRRELIDTVRNQVSPALRLGRP